VTDDADDAEPSEPSGSSASSVVRGVPDTDTAVALLNGAYGDWGDAALFRWKYDDYPGFDPERCFSIPVDGDLAAFRRLFDRAVRGRRDYDLLVLGDTCVAPAHQGKGLYSALHAETTAAARAAGADCAATFNRRGTITFAANRDRGWAFRPLPLHLRILDPSVVLPEYARLALDGDSLVGRILSRVGNRIQLRLADGPVRADQFVSVDGTAGGLAVPVPVPSRLLEAGVEAVVGDPTDAIRRRVPGSGGDGEPNAEPTAGPAVHTELVDTVDGETLAAVEALYTDVLDGYDLHFRRDGETVRHLLDHPSVAGTVLAKRGTDLVGFAPVCLKRSGSVLEAHALDFLAGDERAARALADGVAELARAAGANAVVVVTDRDPGPRWIGVDRQVLMWDGYGADTDLLENGSLFVGFYDVEMG